MFHELLTGERNDIRHVKAKTVVLLIQLIEIKAFLFGIINNVT